MVRKAVIALGFVALTFSGSPLLAEKLSKADRAAIAASAEDVAKKVTIKNDPLDTSIVLSTENFKRDKVNFIGTGADKFLRASIDKTTGETIYQVYFWSQYISSSWAFMDGMTYETPSGPASAEVRRLASDVNCSSSAYVGCTYLEHIAADIPEDILRNVSNGATAGSDVQWKFRISGKSIESFTTGLLTTEIAGLIIAVDAEKVKLTQ